MASKDERKLARTIVDLSRRLDASRARQLPFTSVELDDGTEQGVSDGIGVGRDAYDLTTTHDESISDISDISDSSAIEATFLPELLASGHGSSDAAFELGLATAARVTEARDIADEALEKAIAAGQTAAGFKRVRSATEPPAPEGGWERGDEWVLVHPDTHPNPAMRGKAYEVRVWNGTEFVHAEYLADSILIPSENGTIRLGDGIVSAQNMATDALDAMTVRSLQIYGGYIEAPTIASSAALGGGDNRLNDPRFEGPVGSAWVASGHLGDSGFTQVDNVTWSQPWNWYYNGGSNPSRYINEGRFNASFSAAPRPREAQSITFANYAWYNKAVRNLNNPYTFRALYGTSIEDQLGGRFDPTFKAVDFPAFLPDVPRTTALTNSAVIAVVKDEMWNLKLTAERLRPEVLKYLTKAELVFVNATTNARIAGYQIPSESLIAGNVNVFWKSIYTGNVKFRIEATYIAAGYQCTRTFSASSWANGGKSGSPLDQWSAPGWLSAPFAGFPQRDAGFVATSENPRTPDFVQRLQFNWRILSASFSKVVAGKGWRLSAETGLELFNAAGAKTGQLDGEDNYFEGRLASRNTGARWQIEGDKIQLFDALNNNVAEISRNGSAMQINGGFRFPTDRDTDRIDVAIGATLGPGMVHGVNTLYVGLQAAVQDNVLYITGRLERSGGIPANHVLFTLPAAYRPKVPEVIFCYTGAPNFVVLKPDGECILALASTSYVTISKMVIQLRS